MSAIEYITGGAELLDSIGPLWEKLNEHHERCSRYFSSRYAMLTFARRKAHLLAKARTGHLRVDLAKDAETGQYVGYCVSTATPDRVGEIDSIYVEEAYRHQGIGNSLMLRALDWLNDQGVQTKRGVIVVGNEQVLPFYSRYGFFPRRIELEEVS